MACESQTIHSNLDNKFVIITGSLLLLIIALLSGLWLSMRSRALRAEADLARLRPLLRSQQNVHMLLAESLKRHPLQVTVQRDSLKTEKVKLDGRQTTALHLPAAIAETLGFKGGDVIIVGKSAPTTTTAPTTTAATASTMNMRESR